MVIRFRKRIPLKSGKDLVIYKRSSHLVPRLWLEKHRESTPRLRLDEDAPPRHLAAEEPRAVETPSVPEVGMGPEQTGRHRTRRRRRRRTLQGGIAPVRYPRLKVAAALVGALLLLVFVLNLAIDWTHRPDGSPSRPAAR
jgi:hypothetical protein